LPYLVTGGAGFIGSNIVDELVRGGHDVVLFGDLSAEKEENLTARGRCKESIAEIQEAQRLAPPSLIVTTAAGYVAYFRGDTGQAVAQCQAAVEA